MRSASSRTFCSTSLKCFSSFEIVTIPTTDLCHVSWCSSSATATLKSRRSLSFKLRRTCRLSFSDCASGMCSSRVSKPTGMSGSGGQLGGLFLAGGPAALSGGFRGARLGNAKAFQDIADLHVVEIGDSRAAFKTSAHFACVILESLQRAELRCVNHNSFAQHAHLRVALQDAIDHVAARNRSRTLDPERVAYFRPAQVSLRDHWHEQAFHGFLKLVRNFVNDVVRADVHMFLLRKVQRLAVRSHAKRNHNRPGCGSQQHVIFRDRAHARTDDFQLHLVGRKLRQHFAEHFHGPLHVALDHNSQFLDVAGLQLLVELVKSDARAADARHRRVALLTLAVLDDVPRFGFVSHLEQVARIRHALQTEYFHRRGRRRVIHNTAAIVKHRAHFAENRSADEEVASLQRAVLHQDRSYRAASLVHARFQHRARRRRIRVSLQLPQISNQQNRFQQLLDALLLFRGDFHELRVAAPFRRNQAVFRQLPFRALQLRFRLVDLVDRHDDGHFRSPRVVDRFLRLRHDAIIGRHHQHYDIGNLRASRAHPCKRLVARRIHEHHRAIIDDHLVSADVLGDPARFARGNIRFANGVQQTRLPVIDVAHHRHHRRPRLQTFLGLFLRNLEHHLLFERDHAHYSTERFRKCRCCRHVQRLVNAGKHAAVEQVLQDVLGAHIQLFGQFANRDAFRNRHVARRTRLRRRDDRGRGAAASARTLPRRVQFALTFLLALIQNGTLALRRLARVKRLARLRFRRQFLWKRRQHPRTPRCARAGARSGRHRAATLFKWPRLWSARAAGSWREWPSLSGLLWTHRLPWTRAACTRFSRCVRKRSAIPTRQWTAISCRRWPSWSA